MKPIKPLFTEEPYFIFTSTLKNSIRDKNNKVILDIDADPSESSEHIANINLIKLAPKLYKMMLTVLQRIEAMDNMELSDETRTELIDIMSVIWDTINEDGNLCGVAKWLPQYNQICGYCGNTETGEGGFCAQCGRDHWVETKDFNNPNLSEYINTACKRLNTSPEKLQEKLKNSTDY